MKTSFKYMALGLGLLTMASCNDFLDREPKSDITPQAYFTSEADLAAYTINQYTFKSINNGSYGIGPFGDDNGTDNQAAMSASSFWAPGTWLVGQDAPQGNDSWGKPWNFSRIRQINYFFDQVMPKYNAGQIAGNTTNIRHYIGEAYVIRAYDYFTVLKTIGDAPIVTTALPDDKSMLIEASKREPSNKVARYILATLDTALTYLSETGPGGKNRVTKDVAYLLRSRVALYEGTWLKHHKGTAFVPGGPGWPGKAEDVQGFNIDSEINFFLTECMKSAKVVGDKLVGNLVENTDTKEGFDKTLKELNPYYGMFCNPDMNKYSEVLMWRGYNLKENVSHNIQMQLIRNGGGSGWTRGLVNSFLMRNGLPIYAQGSGYNPDWEKEGVKATLQNRDSRIQQFTKKDGDVEFYTYAGEESLWDPTWMVRGAAETKMVTGFAIKKGKYYDPNMESLHNQGNTGSVVFRGTEALLNYMEACYEATGKIDATADQYWRALRTRAKVDPDYTKTIAATNMQEEAKWDWGAYSHGQLVDATLYNIRRERRDEFIGEGFRWDDLRRWRALDQINGYQIEGLRFWGSIYESTMLDGDGNNLVKVDVEGGTGNISSKEISGDYIHPYQVSKKNNNVFDGYHFTPAHYLNPIPQAVFRQTATGDQTDLKTSNVYQNPGWPMIAGQGPTDVK